MGDPRKSAKKIQEANPSISTEDLQAEQWKLQKHIQFCIENISDLFKEVPNLAAKNRKHFDKPRWIGQHSFDLLSPQMKRMIGTVKVRELTKLERLAEPIIGEKFQEILECDQRLSMVEEELRLRRILDLDQKEENDLPPSAVSAEVLQPSNVDSMATPERGNVFKKEGELWKMGYEGEELPPLKPLRGYEYIHRLLQGEEFEQPLVLYYAVNPAAPGQSQDRYEEGLSVSSGYDQIQQLDNQSKRKFDERLKKRLLELIPQRKKAEQDNDKAQLALINKEFERIKRELKQNTVDRKRKKWNPHNEKARKSISGAIYRAFNRIKKHNPSLEKHLKSHLTPVQFPYCYTPDPPKNWETRKNNFSDN